MSGLYSSFWGGFLAYALLGTEQLLHGVLEMVAIEAQVYDILLVPLAQGRAGNVELETKRRKCQTRFKDIHASQEAENVGM
eukprot:190593-Amphidinium_carterae.1